MDCRSTYRVIKEWRNVLPSIAIISPPLKSKTEFTHDRKQLLNCSGHSLEKKSPIVSCEGIPLGSSKIVFNH